MPRNNMSRVMDKIRELHTKITSGNLSAEEQAGIRSQLNSLETDVALSQQNMRSNAEKESERENRERNENGNVNGGDPGPSVAPAQSMERALGTVDRGVSNYKMGDDFHSAMDKCKTHADYCKLMDKLECMMSVVRAQREAIVNQETQLEINHAALRRTMTARMQESTTQTEPNGGEQASRGVVVDQAQLMQIIKQTCQELLTQMDPETKLRGRTSPMDNGNGHPADTSAVARKNTQAAPEREDGELREHNNGRASERKHERKQRRRDSWSRSRSRSPPPRPKKRSRQLSPREDRRRRSSWSRSRSRSPARRYSTAGRSRSSSRTRLPATGSRHKRQKSRSPSPQPRKVKGREGSAAKDTRKEKPLEERKKQVDTVEPARVKSVVVTKAPAKPTKNDTGKTPAKVAQKPAGAAAPTAKAVARKTPPKKQTAPQQGKKVGTATPAPGQPQTTGPPVTPTSTPVSQAPAVPRKPGAPSPQLPPAPPASAPPSIPKTAPVTSGLTLTNPPPLARPTQQPSVQRPPLYPPAKLPSAVTVVSGGPSGLSGTGIHLPTQKGVFAPVSEVSGPPHSQGAGLVISLPLPHQSGANGIFGGGGVLGIPGVAVSVPRMALAPPASKHTPDVGAHPLAGAMPQPLRMQQSPVGMNANTGANGNSNGTVMAQSQAQLPPGIFAQPRPATGAQPVGVRPQSSSGQASQDFLYAVGVAPPAAQPAVPPPPAALAVRPFGVTGPQGPGQSAGSAMVTVVPGLVNVRPDAQSAAGQRASMPPGFSLLQRAVQDVKGGASAIAGSAHSTAAHGPSSAGQQGKGVQGSCGSARKSTKGKAAGQKAKPLQGSGQQAKAVPASRKGKAVQPTAQQTKAVQAAAGGGKQGRAVLPAGQQAKAVPGSGGGGGGARQARAVQGSGPQAKAAQAAGGAARKPTAAQPTVQQAKTGPGAGPVARQGREVPGAAQQAKTVPGAGAAVRQGRPTQGSAQQGKDVPNAPGQVEQRAAQQAKTGQASTAMAGQQVRPVSGSGQVKAVETSIVSDNNAEQDEAAQDAAQARDSMEEDDSVFVPPQPAPEVKRPTVKVHKSPPPLAVRRAKMKHDSLTMAAPLVRVHDILGDFRKTLWKKGRTKCAQKTRKSGVDVSDLTSRHWKSVLLNYKGLRKNSNLFKCLSGDVSAVSETYAHKLDPHWVLCPHEFKGADECAREGCPFQHRRNYEIAPSEARQQLQLSQRKGKSVTVAPWNIPASSKSTGDLQRGLQAKSKMPGNGVVPFYEGQLPGSVFRTPLLTSACFVSNEVLKSCQLFVDLASHTPPEVIAAAVGQSSKYELDRYFDVTLKTGQHNLGVDKVEANLLTVLKPLGYGKNCAARDAGTRRGVILELAQLIERELPRALPTRQSEIRYWFPFLALASRPDVSQASHRELLQRLFKRASRDYPHCYQISQWSIADAKSLDRKIQLIKDAICNLIRLPWVDGPVPDWEERLNVLGPCVMDLAVKYIYLASCQGQDLLEMIGKGIKEEYQSRKPVKNVFEMATNDFMLVVLNVASWFPIDCFTFWMTLVSCIVHGKVPDEVVHRFGYPKELFTVDWNLSNVEGDRLELARKVLLYAGSSKLGGLQLSESRERGSSILIAAQECLALNVMRFDLAMESAASTESRPVLWNLFPSDNGSLPEVGSEGGQWKYMLCDSAWRASCTISNANPEKDEKSGESGPSVWKNGPGHFGGSLLVMEGIKLNYKTNQSPENQCVWRQNIEQVSTELEDSEEDFGPFHRLHMQQSLWTTYAMIALEQMGCAEAYYVLSCGAAGLKPLRGQLPEELALLEEGRSSTRPTVVKQEGNSSGIPIIPIEKAELCFKVLLNPVFSQMYIKFWNGLEEGEVLNPSCVELPPEELVAGWLNLAFCQLLGGKGEASYGTFRKALEACGGNWALRIKVWKEFLSAVVAVLGPVSPDREGNTHAQGRNQGRWSGWQSRCTESVDLETSPIPAYDQRAPLEAVMQLHGERQKTFEGFKALVLELTEETLCKGRIGGLQSPSVEWQDQRLRHMFTPVESADLTPLVDALRPHLQCLTQSEIVDLVEAVVQKAPCSPSMASFLLDTASLLPTRQLAHWWAPYLGTVLLSANPPVSPALWLEAIQIVGSISESAGKELLERAVLIHPYDKDINEMGDRGVRQS